MVTKNLLYASGILLFIFLILPLCNMPLVDSALASDALSWSKIRQGVAGYTAVNGQESGVLIQSSGQQWRLLRNKFITPLGAWSLFVTAVLLVVFYLLRGPVRLTNPRSGEMVLRWNRYERLIHWLTAIIFLLLSLTGLSLLFGRIMLIPLLGHALYAEYAELAKLAHNFLGPLFIIGLLLMLFHWAGDNLPNASDIRWFKDFGGLIGARRPSAGRMNGGEKVWFWLLIFAGLALSGTGLILDFTNFGQQRLFIQINHIIHACSGILLSIGALGHIYIGTIGSEGALEGMKTGWVDASWAKQHHDLWYKQCMRDKDKG